MLNIFILVLTSYNVIVQSYDYKDIHMYTSLTIKIIH